LAGAPGRGQVRIVAAGGVRGVARAYRRGGALRALATRFLGGSRAGRELAVLVALRARGVPAVEPLAALWQRRGVFYRMRLVTRLVEGAVPLPAFLAAQPAAAHAAVREAGRVVRAAFDAGLHHPDLHPDNLLVSPGRGAPEVRLLDLDRCTLRPLADRDRDRMLLRMARYLERHGAGLPVRGRAVDHVRFLSGMGLDRRARRAELARLHPAYERAVLRHRVAWGARTYRLARSSCTSSSSSARPSSA
jgi:hypothetical protein